ncbi:MAG: hypothetical protein V1726_03510 [Methanobacteriota archaeon]
MKHKTKIGLLQFFLLLALLNLPYLTITNHIGLSTFLDSFENADYYKYVQDTTLTPTQQHQPSYILLQQATHPTFTIREGDTILYYTNDQGILYDTVQSITTQQHTSYYTTTNTNNNQKIPTYNIIGKVVGIIDDNLWNTISIKTWDTSIKNLNIRALLTTK